MYYSRVFKPHSGPERKCSLPVSVTGYQPLIHYLTSWSRATQSNWDAAWTGEGWVGLHRLVWGLQWFMPLLSKLIFAFLPFQMEECMDGQMDRVAFFVSELVTTTIPCAAEQSELLAHLMMATMIPLVTLMIMTTQLWLALLKMRNFDDVK